MLNVSESSFLLLQLNDDGTAVLGQAYSSDDLESLRNSIDTEKLTPEQKTFLDGMKVNDVLAMNGWYTMKPNADGSMVLCVSYEVMFPTETRLMSIASYVKEVSADRMLIFPVIPPMMASRCSMKCCPLKNLPSSLEPFMTRA